MCFLAVCFICFSGNLQLTMYVQIQGSANKLQQATVRETRGCGCFWAVLYIVLSKSHAHKALTTRRQ